MDEADVVDSDVLQAAILHDTVEDTDTTLDEIQDVFGEKVRNTSLPLRLHIFFTFFHIFLFCFNNFAV